MKQMRLRARPILLVLSALVMLTACSGHGAVRQDVAGSNGYLPGDLALDYLTPAHRHAPVELHGRLLDGTSFDLSAWRGKVVVVNYWGSWCAECHAEAQALEQVYQDDRAKGVEFVGVDIRDDVPSAQRFASHFGLTYPSVFDSANVTALAFRHLPPNATPTTYVLDRSGRVAARQNGEILYSQLRDVVARVLAEGT